MAEGPAWLAMVFIVGRGISDQTYQPLQLSKPAEETPRSSFPEPERCCCEQCRWSRQRGYRGLFHTMNGFLAPLTPDCGQGDASADLVLHLDAIGFRFSMEVQYMNLDRGLGFRER